MTCYSKCVFSNGIQVRITEFLDFVHRLVFYKIQNNTKFPKLDLFLSSAEGWQTHTLLGSSERANHIHWRTYNYRYINT
jgi:hypothetical protein